MPVIGFIGMGHMGKAMLQGSLKNFAPTELLFTCPTEAHRRNVEADTGVPSVESNAECANRAKYLVLAVKPQVYAKVLKNIENIVREEHVIISLAPGITSASIKEKLGKPARIVRAMPNTPAMVGQGMTGISYVADEFSFEEQDVIDKLFSSFGKYEKVEESLMDAVVCASGSSPAFVYMFIEALADGAVKQGLLREQAYKMAAQTVKGAAEMVLRTGKHPAQLKDEVCSPGGTTIAGVAVLEKAGFRSSLIQACDEVYEKSVSFSKK